MVDLGRIGDKKAADTANLTNSNSIHSRNWGDQRDIA